MAPPRNPNRDKAYEIWKKHNGDITNRAIAEMLGENEKTIAVWKQRDKWNVVQQSNTTKTNVVQQTEKEQKKRQKDVEKLVKDDDNLTEKQRLFCIYYVKTFNATQAMIKAGYAPDSAHVEGHRLLKKPKIVEYIRKVKADLTGDIFIEAMDVLKKYVKIAFVDISDYITFGKKDVPVMGMFGPVKGEDGKPFMETVSYVELNDSNMVDASIISEVKQGKDGVSIKLADKMKALEKLSMYFDLFPDKFKREIEEEKLKMAKQKIEKDTFTGDVEINVNLVDEDDE